MQVTAVNVYFENVVFTKSVWIDPRCPLMEVNGWDPLNRTVTGYWNRSNTLLQVKTIDCIEAQKWYGGGRYQWEYGQREGVKVRPSGK